ncbi:MAG: asparagine synthase (glutamine-hydrolyzing) [Epsilonproteobacteria bacterium]|nr:asparagine synthase (glutamine-hydrolyzing) [Campylobacterota bacterium]
MCAIAGFVCATKRLDILQQMLNIQKHRGDDDRGVYWDAATNVHLAHNRLSIQDLSTNAHQPMISQCGKYVITFNGEIYNFHSLKTELEHLGYRFVSNSDTEVILYAYKEWGIKCLDRFIGMFAFAILDKAQNQLILARDRLGIKPLYYYDKEPFVFASQIKALFCYPTLPKQLNKQILPYYFQFGYIPEPYAIFQHCYKLPAGCYLRFDLHTKTKTLIKYWDVSQYFQAKLDISYNQALNTLEALLQDSVKLRSIADVEIGVFLSGGYDSSLVSALFVKQHSNINTFTIGFEDKQLDEGVYAHKIAKFLNTNHHEYYITNQDLIDEIEEFSFYYDEPFGDSSALAMMVLSKMTREKVKVVMGADGGDELFVGYNKYFAIYKIISHNLHKYKHIINLLHPSMVRFINQLLPSKYKFKNLDEKFEKFQRTINQNNLQDMFMQASSYTNINIVSKLISTNNKLDTFYKHTLETFDYMSSVDIESFLRDDILVKVDRASMSVALEAREPLIDHRIVEFVAALPTSYKITSSKHLLKQIIHKYIPPTLLQRPKSGFQIPLNTLLRKECKFLVDKYLVDYDGLLDTNTLSQIKYEFIHQQKHTQLVWFIIAFGLWYRRWLHSGI